MKLITMTRLVLSVLMTLALTSLARAADWPQFLGPNRNASTTTDLKLARSWPADGPKVLWSVKVHEGYGGAAIQGGQVFILDRIETEKDVLRCLDLKTGKELWSYSYPAPGMTNKDYPGSRTTPAVDDTSVYIIGPHGQFQCISKTTHKPVWSMNLVKDFGGGQPNWAVAQSPLLYKDMVIVAPLGDDVGLMAVDKATGKPRWKSPNPLGRLASGYVSPVPANIDGVEQLLMTNNAGKGRTVVGGFNAADGSVLWTFDGWKTNIPIPAPLVLDEGRVFLTADYGAGCAMIKVSRADDRFKAESIFANKNCDSHTANPVFYKGYIFANSSRTNRGLVCLDLEGNTKWQTGRNPSFDLGGNLILVNDLIYIINGNTGTLHMVEATPEKYKELASAPMLSGSKIWAPLVFADGKLVLRDHENIKCIDVTAPE